MKDYIIMSIFVWASLAFCFVALLISITFSRSVINPVVPVSLVWFIVILNSVTLVNLIPASNQIYEIILIGLLSFSIGVMVTSKNKFLTYYTKYRRVYIRRKILYLLLIISIFFYIRNIIMLRGSGISGYEATINGLQGGYDLGYSGIEQLLMYYLVEPSQFAVPAVVVTEYLFGKKNKKMLVLTIIMVILASISTGSKNSILMIFVFIIVGILLKNKSLIFNWRKIFLVTFFVLIAVIAMVLLSNARGQLNNHLVQYEMGISPRMFEIWAGEVSSNKIYGYGEASLMGFLYPMYHLFAFIYNALGFDHLRDIYMLIQSTDSQWVNPSPIIKANAYVSWFFFFYLDFRLFGVVLYSFLSGLISNIIFNFAKTLNSKFCISLYMIIFFQLLLTYIRFEISSEAGALSFLYIFILWKWERKSTK